MNNNTFSTYFWLVAMAIAVGALWLADGGDPSAILDIASISQVNLQAQIANLLTVSDAAPQDTATFPTWLFAILFIVGAALAFLWSRIGGDSEGDGGKKQLNPHYHLPILYKVQAKDLDA